MRERKFKKSHIHILQTETLSRLSRVTESAQEIAESATYDSAWYSYITICQDFSLWFRWVIYKKMGFYLEGVWLWGISGVQSQGMMDLVLGYYSLYVTLLKCFDVPKVLEVQEVPFLTYWYVSGRTINLPN